MSDTLTRECPAKVNLFLRVLAREADGFHGIETLFCRIALADTLEITRAEAGAALTVVGAELGAMETNLAWRAAEAVLHATGRRFGVTMRLTKRIPAGGGLGGGSSDAAAAFLAVNQMAGNAIPIAELLHMAYRLGADIPFFIAGGSCALAWGHGQRMLRLPALPAMPVLLLLPGTPIPTQQAYGWIDEMRHSAGPRGSVALDLDVLRNWSDIARLAGNDFEAAVFGRFPAIRAGFEALAGTHPLLCRMSGSGSTLFAVYRNERDRDDAAMQLGAGTAHHRDDHRRLTSSIVSRLVYRFFCPLVQRQHAGLWSREILVRIQKGQLAKRLHGSPVRNQRRAAHMHQRNPAGQFVQRAEHAPSRCCSRARARLRPA